MSKKVQNIVTFCITAAPPVYDITLNIYVHMIQLGLVCTDNNEINGPLMSSNKETTLLRADYIATQSMPLFSFGFGFADKKSTL